jgi:hypothetical protein
VETKPGEVKHPKISDATMKEMAKFFLKTSIPRILAEKKKVAETPILKG